MKANVIKSVQANKKTIISMAACDGLVTLN